MRPGVHELAALLAHRAERDHRPVGRRVAGLLLELAAGHREQVLALLHLALGERPGAEIAVGVVRAAGVPEQHLEPAARRSPVQEDPGRDAIGHGFGASIVIVPPTLLKR